MKTKPLLIIKFILFFFLSCFNASAQKITTYSPKTVNAGTQTVLTITGSGFGEIGPNATHYISFSNADNAGGNTIITGTYDYISWTDTKIVLNVPSTAGTGNFYITNGTKTVLVGALTIRYNLITYNGVPVALSGNNGKGGFTFRMSDKFVKNEDAMISFTKALNSWRCATSVNWTLGPNVSEDKQFDDGINIVRFTNGDEMEDGYLGITYSWYSGCNNTYQLTDADIVFNTKYMWNYDSGMPAYNEYDFYQVALHELGHAHLLGHVINTNDVMHYATYPGKRIELNDYNITAGQYIMDLGSKLTNGCSPLMTEITGGCSLPFAPIITSFTPASATGGTTVTINGKNLTGATSVKFGGKAAASFNVVSATKITAVVGETGSSGSIEVVAPGGTATVSGFTFKYKTPLITAFTPDGSPGGGTVTITGDNFMDVSEVRFGGKAAAEFEVVSSKSIKAVVGEGASGAVSVKTPGGTATKAGFSYLFTLPADNFRVAATDESCRASNNGKISIEAVQRLSYTATVTGNGKTSTHEFTDKLDVENLTAGAYDVCVTVKGQAGYQKCFDLVIGEPKDISAYSVVNADEGRVNLQLDGADAYTVELNGITYNTTASNMSLQLTRGNNNLRIYSNKPCQGVIEKHISLSDKVLLYPNPFTDDLNVDVGKDRSATVAIQVRNLSGRVLYTTKLANDNGKVKLHLPQLDKGVYVLGVILDNSESAYKVIKN